MGIDTRVRDRIAVKVAWPQVLGMVQNGTYVTDLQYYPSIQEERYASSTLHNCLLVVIRPILDT